jgi:ribose transport system ATP-binding protein
MSFVHQDLGLIDAATVVENMRIGRFETRAAWRIPWREERRRVTRALDEFGVRIRPDALVGSLADVDRAMLAIVRAVDQLREGPSGLLVLDEPTAYLPRDGVDQLFRVMRDVAKSGFGVIFISHRLDEVRAITDCVSILRDGALVQTAATASMTEDQLIADILGFSLGNLYPTPHEARSELVMSVRGLSGRHVHDFSLDVHRGEVIGLTGLVGMGWEQVPYLLFGGERAGEGTLTLDGATVDLSSLKPSRAKRLGLALLPANRLRDGAVPSASVTENMTLPTVYQYFLQGYLHRRRETRAVSALMTQFEVTPREPARPLSTLSGGNQQKVLLAKWFETHPKVFLMHEPTQGVDVGARRQIFRLIRDAAQSGTPFILASSEYEDLAHLCDRVIVFRHGQPVSELHGDSLTYERILEQSFRDDRSGREAAVEAR